MMSTAPSRAPAARRPAREAQGGTAFLIALLLLLCLHSGHAFAEAAAGPAAGPAPLTQIGDLRALPREMTAKALPVHVRAVVTWHGPREQITLQDETGGSWLLVAEARQAHILETDDATLQAIRVGHLLDIEGLSDPGSYAPGIRPKKIRILGEQALPPARPFVPSRFFRGAEAGLRVEVRGVVQGFEPAELSWELKIDANPGRFTVEVPQSTLPDPTSIVDAEVRVTGVAVTRVNSRGELTMPRVYSSQPDELVIESPATPPFSAPLVHLDQLLPFRPDPSGPHRKRVVGIVTYTLPGKFLYLQQGTSAVRVETPSVQKFQRGDRRHDTPCGHAHRGAGAKNRHRLRSRSRGHQSRGDHRPQQRSDQGRPSRPASRLRRPPDPVSRLPPRSAIRPRAETGLETPYT